MLPVFLGRSDEVRDAIVIENQGKLGLRAGKYAFMPPYAGPLTNLTGNELGNLDDYGIFDLEADPAQRHNIAGSNPQLLDSLKTLFLDRTMGFYRPFVEEVTLK